MNAIPALVAGVQDVILASPPKPDGTLNAAMLVAARLLGLQKILKAGGAVAMGALAYGWEGFERVDLVVGPGNAYVNEAKRQLWGAVGVDQYAAASEVCVWAHEDAPADLAAADWLTQIEHAADNVGVLIATCADHAQEIIEAAENQLAFAERRDSMRAALRDFGVVVVCPDPTQAVTFINAFAPEHLSILGDEASQWIGDIRNAGCIALGLSTPQSAGDYAAGPSHTLPTSGAARFGGPLNVQTFLKFQSLIHLAEEDLEALAPVIETMGQLEGFPAHANGASVRSRRV
jgi:histidinol dehydrogenase